MSNKGWEIGFHLRSPHNWLNDPKVWEQDGKRRMLPGARHKDGRGEVAVPTPGRRSKNATR
ncbi:MAG: hypothetical protein Q4A07_12770, partial [Coriobacteriales bacterium]|nr:hypothetical protein [Coriobacteriales bacterium]